MTYTKILIGFALLIAATLLSTSTNVLKRKAMLGFGEMTLNNSLSISFWFKVFTNVWIIGIFLVSILMFGLMLIAFSLLRADTIVVMGWLLVVPTYLITLYFNYYWLNEKINSNQYFYIFILLLSILISSYGVWGYLKSGVNWEYWQSKGRIVTSIIQKDLGIFRILTPKEYFKLQGFLKDEVCLYELFNTQAYKLAVNRQNVIDYLKAELLRYLSFFFDYSFF